ncbi:MAG: hypothetical protein IPN29_19540 [Saprospiraceae bacterium]|nr:hypothetical protein [Saprospiraceae bacterium]
MKPFSVLLSYLFHPLFISAYFIWLIYWMNPVFMDFSENNGSQLIIISLLTSTILFPGIAIFMMKGLKLIDSIQMRDKKERVGPLIVTSLFYIWVFLNFKRNSLVPEYITYFMLGATLSLFICFFFTLFFKVSLHTVGFGSLLLGLAIIRFKYAFDDVILTLPGKTLIVSTDLILLCILILGGIVGTSRLLLDAHTPKQVYLGYLLGASAMLAAYPAYY